MRAALAAAAVLAVAACGGAAPHQVPVTSRAPSPAASSPVASPSAPGAAFCARLKAAPEPLTVYTSEIIHQVDLASGGGSASPDDIRAARTIVALWITISCPQYAYLTKGG